MHRPDQCRSVLLMLIEAVDEQASVLNGRGDGDQKWQMRLPGSEPAFPGVSLDIPLLTGVHVSLGMDPGFPPQLKVSGLAGRSYRIDHLTDLRSNNWQTLTTFSLTNSPSSWTDSQASNSSRFYRAVLLP